MIKRIRIQLSDALNSLAWGLETLSEKIQSLSYSVQPELPAEERAANLRAYLQHVQDHMTAFGGLNSVARGAAAEDHLKAHIRAASADDLAFIRDNPEAFVHPTLENDLPTDEK